MPLEELPEKLYGLYQLHKESMKNLEKQGFSPMDAFWIQFAEICPPIVWDENSLTKVKLSVVLRFYLSMYCKQINPQMVVEEESAFLKLLKERYDKVNRIIFKSHPDDTGLAALELGQFLLGKDALVPKAIQAGLAVIMVANRVADTPIPLKLVQDI